MRRLSKIALAVALAASLSVRSAFALDVVCPTPAAPMQTYVRAAAPAGTACVTAERYVNAISEDRANEVADLFAENAVVASNMPGSGLEGRAAIARQYSRVHHPGVMPVAFDAAGADCAITIAAARVGPTGEARYEIISINLFHIDAGERIETMTICLQADVSGVRRD